nr:InlB B-repeat-containing protein [uncultured Carboxylicivirga sp.]
MKKNYLAILLLMISTLTIGQTVDLVKDYYSYENGWGITPNKFISNSQMLVFSGAEAAIDFRGFLTMSNEPFVTDGTADNFTMCDIYPGTDYQSNPNYYFVLNDNIYCVATDTEGEKMFKINDLTGAFEVAATWVPNNKPILITEYGTEKIIFAGTNPDDNTDTNMYLLQWDGTTTSPTIRIASPIVDVSITNKVYFYGGASNLTFLYAKDPSNTDAGYQFCVYIKTFRGAAATYYNLVEGYDDYLEDFTNVGGTVYFNDRNNLVWKFDMDTAEPVNVTSINDVIEENTNLKLLGEYNDNLIFVASPSGNDQRRLYSYDPSTEAITVISDKDLRDIKNIEFLDGMLYFVANERVYDENGNYDSSLSGARMFVYDGATVQSVSDGYLVDMEFTPFNGKMYFSGQDDDGVFEADGTTPATTHREVFTYTPSTTYYITFETAGGTHSNIDRFNSLSETIVLTDAAKEGYTTFDGWYTTADFQAGTEITEIDPTTTTSDITIYAKYSGIITYDLTFDALGGTDNNTVSTYTVDDEVTLVNPTPPTGYKFYRWYTEYTEPSTYGGAYYTTSIPAGTTGNMTLYAKYLTVTYYITYELNGGDKNGLYYKTSYKITDTDISFNAPIKDGYTFAGWYTTSDFQVGTETTGITAGSYGDLTVYAKWEVATAIGDTETDTIIVSPNPSNGVVNISGLKGEANYEIYNLAGNIIEKGIVNNAQIDYDVQSGVYLLKVIEGEKSSIVKIIVR